MLNSKDFILKLKNLQVGKERYRDKKGLQKEKVRIKFANKLAEGTRESYFRTGW